MSERYDVIIIGTGAGGGTVLRALAPTGKRILVLERGRFLPREKANWSAAEVFGKNRYWTTETWRDGNGAVLHPTQAYNVGGNTKFYGGAFLRFRPRDFDAHAHEDGVSPAWPLGYDDFEPWYARAERLYTVHGIAGDDVTEGPRSGPFPYPPFANEPRIAELRTALEAIGARPFQLPLALRRDEADPVRSPCIKCETCDGYPCPLDAKSDADVACVRHAYGAPNVTLVLGARVTRLVAAPGGGGVASVEAEVDGVARAFSAEIVVLSAGAVNSAALLLRSELANGSGQVGRNFMKHNLQALFGVTDRPNPTVFQKTLGLNHLYWGDECDPYPLGHAQLLGKTSEAQLVAEGLPGVEPGDYADAAAHSIDWWLTGEDLPRADNRVRVDGDGTIVLEYARTNAAAFERFTTRIETDLRRADEAMGARVRGYHRRDVPPSVVSHQVGTCRFGADPATSVLDLDCRAHELDNLYVVDASFFPSFAAVNPTLTIAANALRVASALADRLA